MEMASSPSLALTRMAATAAGSKAPSWAPLRVTTIWLAERSRLMESFPEVPSTVRPPAASRVEARRRRGSRASRQAIARARVARVDGRRRAAGNERRASGRAERLRAKGQTVNGPVDKERMAM